MERLSDMVLPEIDNCFLLYLMGEASRNMRKQYDESDKWHKFAEEIHDTMGIFPGGMNDNYSCSEELGYGFSLINSNHPKSAVVYMIENYDGSRVKIGRTNNLFRRYTEISQTSGSDARIVFAMPTKTVGDSRDLEHMCHREFPGQRIQGEWFVAKDEGTNYIQLFIKSLYSMRWKEKEAN